MSRPTEGDVEELVRTALQNRYDKSIRDDIVAGVEVDYVESDGANHIVNCRAHSLKLNTGRVYRDTVDGRDIEFRVEKVRGMGGEYRLRVNMGRA